MAECGILLSRLSCGVGHLDSLVDRLLVDRTQGRMILAVRLPLAKDDHEPTVIAIVNVFEPVKGKASWSHTGFECWGHRHERNGLIESRQCSSRMRDVVGWRVQGPAGRTQPPEQLIICPHVDALPTQCVTTIT